MCLVDCGVIYEDDGEDGGMAALRQESIRCAWDFSTWELSLFT